MKKIILIFIVGFSFFACKQDNLNRDETTGLTTARNNNPEVLSFTSVADYQRIFEVKDFLSSKLTNTNFTSLASKLEKYEKLKEAEKSTENILKQETDSLYTDYGVLTKILNEDRIVKIGKNYIKVDLPTEQVLVLNESNASEYKKLVANDITDSHIMVFSTDEDVLTLLAEGSKGTVNNSIMRCSDPRAEGDSCSEYGYNGNRRRVKIKCNYQRAGIYFSLIVKSKTQRRSLGIWWLDRKATTHLTYLFIYEKRCDSSGIYYDYGGSVWAVNGKAKSRVYESFEALLSYELGGAANSANGLVSCGISG